MRVLYEITVEAASIEPLRSIEIGHAGVGSEMLERAKVRLTREQLSRLIEQLLAEPTAEGR